MFSFFKLFTLFWPFFWEMIAGKISVKEAWKKDKKKVLFTGLLVLSLVLNFRFGYILSHSPEKRITNVIVDANRRDKEEEDLTKKVEEPTPIGAPPHSPIPTTKSHRVKEVNDPNEYDRLKYIQKRINQIKIAEEDFLR